MWKGGPTAIPLEGQGHGTRVQGLPPVRAPVVHVGVEGGALLLAEAPAIRRALLGGERTGGEASAGTQPTKAFLSRLSTTWLQPGWLCQGRGPRACSGLWFPPSPTLPCSLEEARTGQRAAATPQPPTLPGSCARGTFACLPPGREATPASAVLAAHSAHVLGRGLSACPRLEPQCLEHGTLTGGGLGLRRGAPRAWGRPVQGPAGHARVGT